MEGFNVDVMDHEGHGDCTWCVPKPGCIVTLFEIQNYEDKFPGLGHLLPGGQVLGSDESVPQGQAQERRQVVGAGRGGQQMTSLNTWRPTLKDWVGYVEETVFEVNMLSIDENTILVNNYNKQVFDFLDRHHITPVITPFRHQMVLGWRCTLRHAGPIPRRLAIGSLLAF
jgi:hypothetical protein